MGIPTVVKLLSFLEAKAKLIAPPRRILVSFQMPEALRDVLAGIARYARENRLSWQILCVNADEFAANFAGHRSDGAIVLVRPQSHRLVRRLSRSPTPVVNLLRHVHPRLPSVMSDDHAIGRLGAAHLLSLGFRKMGFVTLDTPWSRRRQAGFTDALREAGLPPPVTTESLGVKDFRFLSKVRAMRLLGRWARALGPRVGVMAPSDFVARTLLTACQAEGIDVPKDIAVLGVDNFPAVCEAWPVSLSSIAQDFARMGFEAARLLDEQMNNRRKRQYEPVLVPPGRLHVRASTDVLAFDDPLIVEALRAIHEHADTGISMSELLRRIPLSRRWLDHRFKQAVGHTPIEEIRRCRLRAARDLLIETELPLRQIAMRCRFPFPENLIRSFKAAYGLSPHAYKLKHRLPPA
jgi:LacI family transcriptional regulator